MTGIVALPFKRGCGPLATLAFSIPRRQGARTMAYAIGIVLALLVVCFASWTRFDRDRAFYPTLVVVIASYYVLFAVIGGSTHALVAEALVMAAFALVAVLGFKFSPWLIVAGLAAHGVFDAAHPVIVTNPGVPAAWPAFCLAFDVGAAGLVALRLMTRPSRRPHAPLA
jgi:hypothetical protein